MNNTNISISGVSTASSGMVVFNIGSSESMFSNIPGGNSPWSIVQWFKNTGGAFNFWTGDEVDLITSSALSGATETPTAFNAGGGTNDSIYYLDALAGSAPAPGGPPAGSLGLLGVGR